MALSTLRFFKTFLAAGSLALLGACAPSYYVMVKPATPDGRWLDGMEVVASKADSLDVRLGVVSTNGQWLEFDVAVQNRSSRPVVVAPETFYLDAYGATSGGAVVATAPLRVQAENPERNIQSLQQQAQFHEQKSTARPAGEMLSSLANLIDDFSGKHRRANAQQRALRDTNRQAELVRYEQERAKHAVQAASAREQARQLEANLLRRSTVAAGQTLRGRVRFRRYTDAATRLRVVTPVAGRELAAEFSQQRFRLDDHQVPTAQSAPAKKSDAGRKH